MQTPHKWHQRLALNQDHWKRVAATELAASNVMMMCANLIGQIQFKSDTERFKKKRGEEHGGRKIHVKNLGHRNNYNGQFAVSE